MTVEAKMKSTGGSDCFGMNLFSADTGRNTEIALEIGGKFHFSFHNTDVI